MHKKTSCTNGVMDTKAIYLPLMIWYAKPVVLDKKRTQVAFSFQEEPDGLDAIRAEGTLSQKVGSETKALWVRLQANSRLERDLLRKRRNSEAGDWFFCKKIGTSVTCSDVVGLQGLYRASLGEKAKQSTGLFLCRSPKLTPFSGSSPWRKNTKK